MQTYKVLIDTYISRMLHIHLEINKSLKYKTSLCISHKLRDTANLISHYFITLHKTYITQCVKETISDELVPNFLY